MSNAMTPTWIRRKGSTERRVVGDLEGIIENALPGIFGYILVRVDNRSTAEDLTQETMLALVQAANKSGSNIEDPVAWLFGTARFKVIDHYRLTERSLKPGFIDTEVLGSVVDVVADIDWVLDREDLLRALAAIAPNQRIALLLHYADDLPISEVSRLLGKSEHAVESLLARGRRSLRNVIAGQEI